LIVSFDDEMAASPDAAQVRVEVCDDGIDNNDDGLVDCQDPECQPNYMCVMGPPAGFSLTYVSDGQPADCPGGDAPRTVYTASSPTCDLTGCACGPPNGGCSVTASLYTTQCMGGTASNLTMTGFMCYGGLNGSTSGSFTVSTASVSCAAMGTATTTPGPQPAALRVCGTTTGGGCPAGEACVLRPTAGFGAVCAIGPGAQTCPADRPQQRTTGDSFNDQRTCTCGCSSTDSCASTQVAVYGNGFCNGGGSGNLTPSGNCQVFSGPISSMRPRNTVPAACQRTATLSGINTVANQQTLCCP
jgi:hypothetical protein